MSAPRPPASPTTAREALLAELIGEVAQLLSRAETLTQQMNTARQGLANAAVDVVTAAVKAQAQVTQLGGKVQRKVIEHVRHRTNEITRDAFSQQRSAMAESARTLFHDEVGPTLAKLTADLRAAIEKANHPWDGWLAHAATATFSAAGSAWLMFVLLRR